MQLVYATEQRERDFKIAEEQGRVPAGARIYATCTPEVTTENVGEITFQGMTDEEYYTLKAMVREAQGRARAEQSEARRETANKTFNFFRRLFTR
jgi:hypothetical protein